MLLGLINTWIAHYRCSHGTLWNLIIKQYVTRRHNIETDLFPLVDPFVDELCVGLSGDKAALSWLGLQLTSLIDHLPSGDGHHGNTVAFHALKDVVIHSLVVRSCRDLPTHTQTRRCKPTWSDTVLNEDITSYNMYIQFKSYVYIRQIHLNAVSTFPDI